MNLEEAVAVLHAAEGRFTFETTDRGLRVKYTGTDPEEEGRCAQALLIVVGEIGLEMTSLKTDPVHERPSYYLCCDGCGNEWESADRDEPCRCGESAKVRGIKDRVAVEHPVDAREVQS